MIEADLAANTDHSGNAIPLRYIHTPRRAHRVVKETAQKLSSGSDTISYKTIERFVNGGAINLDSLLILARLVRCGVTITITELEGKSVPPVFIGRRRWKTKGKHPKRKYRPTPY